MRPAHPTRLTDAQRELVAANLKLAYWMARRAPIGSRDDRAQDACLALAEAALRYDPARGPFGRYAATAIGHALAAGRGRDAAIVLPDYLRGPEGDAGAAPIARRNNRAAARASRGVRPIEAAGRAPARTAAPSAGMERDEVLADVLRLLCGRPRACVRLPLERLMAELDR